MIDYSKDVVIENYEERKQKILDDMENLENKTSAIREMVDKPEVRKMLEGKVDFQYLTNTYGVCTFF